MQNTYQILEYNEKVFQFLKFVVFYHVECAVSNRLMTFLKRRLLWLYAHDKIQIIFEGE